MKELLKKLSALLLRNAGDRRAAAVLLLLMTVAAALEAVGIGLIMPFVALIQNPDLVEKYAVLRTVRDGVGATHNVSVVYLAGIAMIVMFVAKNAYLAFVQGVQFRYIFTRQATVSRALVNRFMTSDYTFHLNRNSAELIQAAAYHVSQFINHVVVNVFVIAVEVLTIAVIFLLLLAVEPIAVPTVGLVLGAVALLFYRAVNRRSLELGKREAEHLQAALQWLQQGLGGIKETLVLGREKFFVAGYDRESVAYNRSQGFHRMVQLLPRYVLETLGVAGLVAIGLSMLARGNDASRIVPSLGVIAVAAIRLLPALARILGSLTDLRHHTHSADLLSQELRGPEPTAGAERSEHSSTPLPVERDISFKGVSFNYENVARPALEDVSFTVQRGESIAFVGASGAGKTTLVDLLIGLLRPTAGTIEVDGEVIAGDRVRRWQRSIGYIPQSVYLSDDSVLHNIAFGLKDEEIDRERVKRALEQARLLSFVEGLPQGLETFVGERGARLSGGQRQRIGIARALYLEPDVLVLDEATASLDGQTEREIVENLEQVRRNRTAFIVAHRLSTVRRCDRIVFLSAGRVEHIGTWDELNERSDAFRNLVRLGSTHEAANAP